MNFQCPVCDMQWGPKGQNRNHIAFHFMDELRDFVRSTGWERACTMCSYTTDKMDHLVKHYALGHSRLDEYLLDDKLMEHKRAKAPNKPKRMDFGKDCPICGQVLCDRGHIARHFMPQLLEMVAALPDTSKCDQCNYANTRDEYMAKHLALFHCRLDELMQDEALVATKKHEAKTTPSRGRLQHQAAVHEPVRKSRRRS